MRVLFLEPERFYNKLGISTDFSIISAEYNGLKRYKNDREFFKGYDVVITGLYHSALAQYVTQKANHAGVTTVLLMDGIFDWANVTENPVVKKSGAMTFHPVVHDYFFVIGEEERLYFESRLTQAIKYLPRRIFSGGERLPVPDFTKFLITTANTAYFDSEERDKLLSMLRAVVSILEENGIDYFYRIFDEYLVEKLGIDSRLNKVNGEFEGVLSECSSVITTPSSIALSAMYHRRSVGTLIFRDTPMFIQSGWLLLVGSNFRAEVNSLKNMDIDRIRYQDFVVDRYVFGLSESFEKEVLKLERVRKDSFLDQNCTRLIDSPFNFNFECLARRVWSILEKNNYLYKFIRRFKNR